MDKVVRHLLMAIYQIILAPVLFGLSCLGVKMMGDNPVQNFGYHVGVWVIIMMFVAALIMVLSSIINAVKASYYSLEE
jgi:uncharacterized membrane protein (DUF485 family)